MSNIMLVTGPVASGKTEAAVSFLAEHYAANPFVRSLVLVPTTRHADQFRQRLVSRQGVCFNIEVITPGQFASKVVAAQGGAVASNEVVDALLEQCLRELAEAGDLGYLGPLADQPGLTGLVSRELEGLFAEAVLPDDFVRVAAGDRRLESLATAYRRLSGTLSSRGLVHPLSATDSAAAMPTQPGGLVVVDGFRVLSAGEIRLVASLTRSADAAVVTFDPTGGERPAHDAEVLVAALPEAEIRELPPRTATATLSAGLTPGREDEVRAVARHMKALLAASTALRPSSLAVGVRQSAGYVRLVRQVFVEFDLPLDVAAAERLTDRPLGAWISRLVRLGSPELRLKDVLAVLRSGFFDTRLSRLTPAHLGVVAAEARRNRVWGGDDLLERILASLSQPRPNETPALRLLLDDSAGTFEKAIPQIRAVATASPAPARVQAARLAVTLFGPEGLVPPGVRENIECRAEVAALQRLLLGIQAADEAVDGPEVEFAAFADRLLRAMERPLVQIREAGGVLLAPLHTLQGLRFAHVALLGLADGEFPAPRPRPPLLGPRQREHLADAGFAVPPPARASEIELWTAAKSRADIATTAWRTRYDDKKRERAASSFFAEALAAGGRVNVPPVEPEKAASQRELVLSCVREWPAASRPREFGRWEAVREGASVERLRRSFEAAPRFEGVVTGTGLQFVSDQSVWSATRFESYRTCPFQFFGAYVLHLGEVDKELDEPDAAVVGTVVHSILESLLAPLAAQRQRLDSTTLVEVKERLSGAVDTHWETALSTYSFGRKGLWAIRRKRIVGEIARLLEREAAESEALGVRYIQDVEHKVQGSLPTVPPLQMTGKIDRVDIGDDFTVVVDYKSSSQIALTSVTSGEKLQLQLYGEMARQEAGVGRVVGRYALLRAPDNKGWQIDSDDTPEVFAEALEIATNIAQSAGSGAFAVHPTPPTCPTYCAYKDACRVNQFSRLKWPGA